jgi:undecaprenyl-diphosphatase
MPPLPPQRWPHERGDRRLLAIVAVILVLCVWLFVELARNAARGDYLEYENQILLAFRTTDDPARGIGPYWMPEMARDVTALGSAFVLTLVTVVIIALLIMRRRARTALLILVATLGGYGISSGLKELFARGRPDAVPHLTEEISMSFPSGHSMVGAAFYLTLGVLLAQTVAHRREKIYFVGVALFITFLIGVSRVYLGVHYPSDVVGGWAAGSAWALLCWATAWYLQQRGAIRTVEQADAEEATAPAE